jgi:hypothetical protein
MSPQPETRNQEPETKLTRRALAGLLSTSAALLAQTPSVPLPANPDEELKAAKDTIQKNSEQLAKFDLKMATEPAVHFRA